MGYKVANLVKEIKASDKTNSTVYTEANKFIQEVQGKSFNDFSNIAKKKNYTLLIQNGKTFPGTNPGNQYR